MQRLIELHPLQRGAHPSRDQGMCAMEMVAWLAGEPHSDEPKCACPVLAAFVRACNDTMSDAARNRHLRPLVPLLVNSRGSAAIERVRGLVVVDGLVRTLAPALLRRYGRKAEATLLGDLPPLQRLDDVRHALRLTEHFAHEQHATRWVLERALEGLPPARYAAGAVQVARRLSDAVAWPACVAIVQRMVAATLDGSVQFAE